MEQTYYLRDNHFGEYASALKDISMDSQILLGKLSGLKVSDFSHLGVNAIDGSGDAEVFSFRNEGDRCYIDTGNVMGVLRLKDIDRNYSVLLQIQSRFDTGDKQFFLTYLLSKIFGGTFVDETIPSDSASLWDMLLAYLFKRQFSRSAAVGLYSA